MYPVHQGGAMPPPMTNAVQQPQRSVNPESFLLEHNTQQSLPADSVVALQQVDNLKYFLISAPVDWTPDQYIRRFLLPTGEYVSCVLWNNLFHISGTDIVRCLAFRFQAFGRPVKNNKKFEEGIFSDLRNLKSGTDASLEEPKSAFLDFMYKNNCIRTQKKQKVFYWYSVPHDRLFLDALERDLKREKSGQEATTMAVSEPALSFEFDSSQSLFEQLTKAQQSTQSSFGAQQGSSMPPSHSTSPVLRAADSMPPPTTIPQQAVPDYVVSQNSMPPVMLDDAMTQVPTYSQMAMMPMPPMPSQIQRTREQSVNPLYDRNGVPLSQVAHRHSSMPAYMEYSPAPSFVSSHYEDYSQRGLSFEPITPPQHTHGIGAEPAYIANEDTGLYTAIPDVGLQHPFNPFMAQPANFSGMQFSAMPRTYAQPVHPVLEGSPTYKQRRRRSSLTPGAVTAMTSGAIGAHAVHRPSDLRRSVSQSVVPQTISEGPEHLAYTHSPMGPRAANTSFDMSRHSTPLSTCGSSYLDEHSHAHSHTMTHDFASYNSSPVPDYHGAQLQQQALQRSVNGPMRRARSATISELGPYPQKSHSCPIPMCGRLFKRLEHLKRHVRTHTQERPYVCNLCSKAFSRSDNLAQHRRTHESSADGLSEEDLEDEHDVLEPAEDMGDESFQPIDMVAGSDVLSTETTSHVGLMGPPPRMVHTGEY